MTHGHTPNVLYSTSFKNYPSFSLQVPSILSILVDTDSSCSTQNQKDEDMKRYRSAAFATIWSRVFIPRGHEVSAASRTAGPCSRASCPPDVPNPACK